MAGALSPESVTQGFELVQSRAVSEEVRHHVIDGVVVRVTEGAGGPASRR